MAAAGRHACGLLATLPHHWGRVLVGLASGVRVAVMEAQKHHIMINRPSWRPLYAVSPPGLVQCPAAEPGIGRREPCTELGISERDSTQESEGSVIPTQKRKQIWCNLQGHEGVQNTNVHLS